MGTWAPSGVIAAHLAVIAKDVAESLQAKSFDRSKCILTPNILPTFEDGIIAPDRFYHPKVFVWVPQILCDSVEMKCPNCSNIDIREVGWVFRRIVDISTVAFILAKQYVCKRCERTAQTSLDGDRITGNNATFSPCDAQVLNGFPSDIQACFPAVMDASNQGGVSRDLVDLIRACGRANLSIDQIHSVITDTNMAKYSERRAAFEACAAQAIQGGCCSDMGNATDFKFFSSFDDREGYGGFVPPPQYLLPFCVGNNSVLTDALWTKTVVVAATEARPIAAYSSLPSLCAQSGCPGFSSCDQCHEVQRERAPTGSSTAVPAIRVNSEDIELAISTPMEVNQQSATETSGQSGEPKRKRRPRRCQNRILVNDEVVICGLIDCPGRGEAEILQNFSRVVWKEQQQSDDIESGMSKLSTLVTAVRPVRPVRESELVAMEALQKHDINDVLTLLKLFLTNEAGDDYTTDNSRTFQ